MAVTVSTAASQTGRAGRAQSLWKLDLVAYLEYRVEKLVNSY